MTSRCSHILAAAAGVALCFFAAGADDATQTIDAKGMTFLAPASWKSSTPSNKMRRAQLTIEPAEGDKSSAELAVFGFPEGGGTVRQNVTRWENQFKDANGQRPKAKTEKVQGKNTEVTRVELSGEYTDPFAGKGAQPDYHLLGAIVESGKGTAYFLKLVGPEKTVSKIKPQFDKMLKTIEVK
jgi:hypothetical protein